jgi:hypothetical protein
MYLKIGRRAQVIKHMVAVMGVDYADAAIITDYAHDRGPHFIPGHPELSVWWARGLWIISDVPASPEWGD